MSPIRVLQVGSDRSKRGTLVAGSAAELRQQAFAKALGHIDDVSFTLASDGRRETPGEPRAVYPTNSASRYFYILDARSIARGLSRPDVVSAQDPFEAGLAGYLIARHFRAPLHIQVHTDFLDPAYAKHSRLNRIRIRIAGFVLARASGIRVVSERIKRSLETAGYTLAAPIAVLPMYADIERIKKLPPSPQLRARFERYRYRVLVVSRLEPEKRVSLAIDSFVRANREDACLIIVGEGSERDKLEALARGLGVADHVFFEGGAEAAPYYHLADLVVVPSEYEGYGLIIVEALSMGKPVLSTDVGIAREAGATFIAPASLFAEALQKWFDHGPHTGALALRSYPDFDTYVKAYADDIRSCLGHG